MQLAIIFLLPPFFYSLKLIFSDDSPGSLNLEIPDMAWMLGPQHIPQPPQFDVVVLLRDDLESLLPASSQLICEEIMTFNYSCIDVGWDTLAQGIPLNFSSPQDLWRSAVQRGTSVVSIGRVMITDRLHGTVLSYLTGIGVVYIENLSKKTSGVLKVAFGCGNQASENSSDTGCPCMYSDPMLVQSYNDLNDIVARTREMLEHMSS